MNAFAYNHSSGAPKIELASGSGCGSLVHLDRRNWMRAAAAFGVAGWLTPVSQVLARQAENQSARQPAKSVIVLWLQGGPSQLETFDPHPGTNIAGESKAIETRLKGVQVGDGLPQVADKLDRISLVRSVTSREGDHERAIYNIKTGFRPDPTLIHPSVGAIVCHQTEDADRDQIDIPRHISILPDQFSSRGGYLGTRFDPFKTGDPNQPLPDLVRPVDDDRYRRRLTDLTEVVDREFARGRINRPGIGVNVARDLTQAALKMMDSAQLAAFDVGNATAAQRDAFGDTAFGRGCLAAVRLIETGVRCVEVTLSGWDSHINNHEIHAGLLKTLDPAFAALINELESRDLLQSTVVMCAGEFGRTPTINPAGGRDHWPHGFSVALAGGGVQGGRVIGATSPNPKLDPEQPMLDVENKVDVQDLHATILSALDINPALELQTPIGRPMTLTDQGRVLTELLES